MSKITSLRQPGQFRFCPAFTRRRGHLRYEPAGVPTPDRGQLEPAEPIARPHLGAEVQILRRPDSTRSTRHLEDVGPIRIGIDLGGVVEVLGTDADDEVGPLLRQLGMCH